MNKPFALLALCSMMALMSACEPRSAQQCADDVEGMREVISDAVDEAAYCQTDSDCAVMDPSNACEDRCAVAVNVAEVNKVEQRIFDGELSFCVGYGEDCGFTSVSCEARYPVCNAGRCDMVADY